jgi:sodium/potassium-transporting ATPase subunit alpha
MQVGNVLACRSSKDSIVRLGVFSNRLAIVGIAFELTLTAFIIYHPVGNKIFGTAPLGASVWLILIPFSIGLLGAEELRKFFIRRSLT